VKDFGAVGNGSTDDTTAINNAINWLNGENFRGLYFPSGDYRITSTLTITGRGKTLDFNDARIRCTNGQTFLQLGTSTNICERVIIQGLKVIYTIVDPSPNVPVFKFSHCTTVNVRNIHLQNYAKFAVYGENFIDGTNTSCKILSIQNATAVQMTELGPQSLCQHEIIDGTNIWFEKIVQSSPFESFPTSAATWVLIKPKNENQIVDTIRINSCAWQSNTIDFSKSMPYGLRIDNSNGPVTNILVTNTVFDWTSKYAVFIEHNRAVGMRWVSLLNNRFSNGTGGGIRVTSTVNDPRHPLQLNISNNRINCRNSIYGEADHAINIIGDSSITNLNICSNSLLMTGNYTGVGEISATRIRGDNWVFSDNHALSNNNTGNWDYMLEIINAASGNFVIGADNLYSGTTQPLKLPASFNNDQKIRVIPSYLNSNELRITSDYNSPFIKVGSNSPEGVVTAKIGSLYMRTDGGVGTTLYVKESGTGNTGWIAK
jgi:hypothetical protein